MQGPIGRAVERPTGATLNRRTLLAFLPRIPIGDGRGNSTKRRVLAATAQANRPVLPPDETWGETETEQTSAGAQRPTSQATNVAARMNNMEVGRPGRPSPTAPVG